MENILSEEQIKLKRLEVLEDVATYFNLETRNADNTGTCKYLPISEKSQGCAVGRLIKDKELCAKLDNLDDKSGVYYDNIFEQLPKEVQILGQLFLMRLQDLHDNPNNWIETGLSHQGNVRFNDIKNTFID